MTNKPTVGEEMNTTLVSIKKDMDKLNRLLPENKFSIQKFINEELNKESKDDEITSWHSSQLGSCLTGAYLRRIGTKPDVSFDDRTLRVFGMGRFVENWVVEVLKKTDLKIKTQGHIEILEYTLPANNQSMHPP